MITKALILDKQDNKYLVRIPLFEYAGSSNLFEEYATVAHDPGNVCGYEKNDVVFVDFENNDLGKPVIIGKLFLENSDKNINASLSGSSVEINAKAVLPANITIGQFTPEDVYNTLISTQDLLDRVAKLEEIIKNGTSS